MRHHAQVRPTFWTKGSGKKLRGDRDAQLVALYLITGESSTMCGIYYLPLTTLCHHMGMTHDEAMAALKRTSAVDMAHYDEEAELVWVPKLAEQELGDSMSATDKRHAGLVKSLREIGNHPFVDDFYERYSQAYSLPDRKPLRSPSQAPSKPLPDYDSQTGSPSEGALARALVNPVSVSDPVSVPDREVQEGAPHPEPSRSSLPPPAESAVMPVAAVAVGDMAPIPPSPITPELVARCENAFRPAPTEADWVDCVIWYRSEGKPLVAHADSLYRWMGTAKRFAASEKMRANSRASPRYVQPQAPIPCPPPSKPDAKIPENF